MCCRQGIGGTEGVCELAAQRVRTQETDWCRGCHAGLTAAGPWAPEGSFQSLWIVSLWLYCLSKTLPIFIIGVVIVLTKTCVMSVRMKPSIWLLTLKPYLLLPNSVTWGKLRCPCLSHPQGVGNSTWLATLWRGLCNVFKTPSSVWALGNGLLERPSVRGALFS